MTFGLFTVINAAQPFSLEDMPVVVAGLTLLLTLLIVIIMLFIFWRLYRYDVFFTYYRRGIGFDLMISITENIFIDAVT